MGQAQVRTESRDAMIDISVGPELWTRAFAVTPLVLIGTKEGDGHDFAPKHMAMPLGWEGFYCFVCSSRHSTYRNIDAHHQFTASFPRPEQIVESSLAAGGRVTGEGKPSLAALTPVPARIVDVPLVRGCWFYLECELERIIDGFGPNSLVVGRVVAAAAASDALRAADVDDADLIHRLGLVAYLPPGRFAVVRESHAFPYPVDFRT